MDAALEPVRGTALRHAPVLLLAELAGAAPESSVRVVGRASVLDLPHDRATLTHGAASVAVDTSLLGATLPFRVGALVQVIGELELRQGRVVLVARVCRAVDGLNMDLYAKSVMAQRAFLQRLDAAVPELEKEVDRQ